MKTALLVIACVLSTLAIANADGECDYCVQKINYVRSQLPNNGTTVSQIDLVVALKQANSQDQPYNADCFDYYDSSKIQDVLSAFHQNAPTTSICSSFIPCVKVLALIFC
uniref:Saposin B-type domain-containing protein n=1 Tax=Panagrellus redivivus TaxID=6233 RepID=A0A7E4VK69_PANRE